MNCIKKNRTKNLKTLGKITYFKANKKITDPAENSPDFTVNFIRFKFFC